MVSLANDTYQFETYKTVRFYFNEDRSDEQYLRIDFDVTSKNETSDTIINNADRNIDKITAGDTEEVEGGEVEAVADGLLRVALSDVQMAAFFRPSLIFQVPEPTAYIMKVGWLESQNL